MNPPSTGDTVYMGISDDVSITVYIVPVKQPHAKDGIYEIRDQYGDLHYVERDAESWVTVHPNNLPI